MFNKINITHIKIIAIFAMTVDHLKFAGINLSLPFFGSLIMAIGRMAAPLFMFALVSGMKHTGNKRRFLLRLYVSNVIISLVSAVLIMFGIMGSSPAILATYFYVAVYGFIIEKITQNIHASKVVLPHLILILAITIIPILIDRLSIASIASTPVEFAAMNGVLRAVLPNIWTVDYSLIFVIMGVIWYFFSSKYTICLILIAFSIISFIGANKLAIPYFIDFFSADQWLMAFAAMIIILYNGERGRGGKYFFYIYYPAHIYLLCFISTITT